MFFQPELGEVRRRYGTASPEGEREESTVEEDRREKHAWHVLPLAVSPRFLHEFVFTEAERGTEEAACLTSNLSLSNHTERRAWRREQRPGGGGS